MGNYGVNEHGFVERRKPSPRRDGDTRHLALRQEKPPIPDWLFMVLMYVAAVLSCTLAVVIFVQILGVTS